MPGSSPATWTTVCGIDDLPRDGGVCAIVEGVQVAIFYESRSKSLYAVSNYDPIGRAFVMSRGIIGSLAQATVVASPLYKQHFDLTTGHCIERPEFQLDVYAAQFDGGAVQVRLSQEAT